MLKHMLEALPGEERLAFLHEVYKTLDPDQQRALRKLLQSPEPSPPAPAPLVQTPPTHSPPKTEADRQALVEEAFQRISAQHRDEPNMRKEFYSCLGLGVAGAVVLVLITLAGGELVAWVKDVLLGP